MRWIDPVPPADPARSLRKLLTNLVEATQHSTLFAEEKQSIEAARKESEERIEKIEEMKNEIQSVAQRYSEDDVFSEAGSKIVEFSEAVFSQMKERIQTELQDTLRQHMATLEAEKSKALKSLEAFFIGDPLPLLDRLLTLDKIENGYAASASYRCDPSIEYEFTLDSRESEMFRGHMPFSRLVKGARIPVRLGKNWLKKEAVPDYEKLDQYVLVQAELSQGHLIARFEREDGYSVRFVYSKSEDHSSITVIYKDELGEVEVTSDPALSNRLEEAPLIAALEPLANEIVSLEGARVRLSKLKLEGTDVLSKLNCYELLITASNSVSQLIRESLDSRDAMSTDLESWLLSNNLGPDQIRERLKILGDKAVYVARALGLGNIIYAEPKS
ncbi:MAG: hypothetical protein QW767_00640 [Thermoprotei archaeon]